MRVALRAVIAAMIWLATTATVSGGVDLIFSDSFEECLAEPLALWSGSGDGTSWSDPLNWKDNQLPAANEAVRIRDGDEITVIFDNSAGTVSINCLVSDESILISGGSLSIDASSSIDADLTISNGTLSMADKLRVSGALQHTGGTLDGDGVVTVQGLYSWSDGSQSGTGETVAAGGLALTGTPHKTLQFRTLTLEGNSTFADGGNLRFSDGVTLNNNGNFEIQNDSLFDHRTGTFSTFNNNGTLTKTAGAGVTQIEADINNSGNISLSSGSMSFNQNFLQDINGSINVGIASGADFDRFLIGIAANLNGTLNIVLEGGFQPGLGESFQILTFDSRAGTFSTVNGLVIGNGNKFDVSYGTLDVNLDVVTDN